MKRAFVILIAGAMLSGVAGYVAAARVTSGDVVIGER
jgi:hypothetical protein